MFANCVLLALLISFANGSPTPQQEPNPCLRWAIQITRGAGPDKNYVIDDKCYNFLLKIVSSTPTTASEGLREDEKPREAEEVETPHEAETVETSHEAETVETPHEAETIETPHEAETVETSHEAETVETPHEAETVETPHEAETIETPHEAETIETPHEAETIETPHGAEEVETPLAAEPVETPHEAEAQEVESPHEAGSSVPRGTIASEPVKKTYVIHKHNATWLNAWNNCKAEGKEMATVKSAEEQQALVQLFITSSNLTPFLWLGGMDLKAPRDYSWVHSDRSLYSDVAYSNWKPGQPHQVCRTCIQVSSTTGKWYAVDCSTQYAYYICETDDVLKSRASSGSELGPNSEKADTDTSETSVSDSTTIEELPKSITADPCVPGSYQQQGNTNVVNNHCYQSLLSLAGSALVSGPCATKGFQEYPSPSFKAYIVNNDCFKFVWDSVTNSNNPADSPSVVEENVTPVPGRAVTSATPKKSKYTIHNQKTTWHLAWNNCKSGHQELATVKSFQDHQELQELLTRSETTSEYFWLGATDQQLPGEFSWVHSKSADYQDMSSFTRWQPGYPKQLSTPSSCVQARKCSGQWINADCAQYAPYICESKQ